MNRKKYGWVKRINLKHMLTVILSFLMILEMPLPAEPVKVQAMTTQSATVNWIRSQKQKAIDMDGLHGAQCVDLIAAYFDYLGVPWRSMTVDYAKDYTWRSIPGGWQRIQGASIQAGDIVIWTGGEYGHVALAISGDRVVEQNWAGYKYCRENPMHWDNNYWGVIRPNFNPEVNSLPEGAPRTVSDGDYHIVSALSGTNLNPGGQCLTIGGLPGELKVDKANMCIWPSSDWSDSVVTITWLGNGFYKIKVKNSGNKCLDVAGGETKCGANVQQYEDNGTFAQQWQIDEISDGNGYAIRSRCSGLYMDVDGGSIENGTNVQLWNGNGTDAQRWYLIPWRGGSSAKQEMPDGDYEIVPKDEPDKALATKEDGRTNGANVELDSRGSDGKHTFRVTWLGNGYYQIVDNNSKLSLDVFGGRSLRGTNLQLYELSNNINNAQRWIIKSCGNGYYNIISKCNGLYLDLAGAKTDIGTNVQMYVGWGINGADCQQWRFIPWGESIGQTIEDGEYQIVSQLDDNKTLSVEKDGEEYENGTNIELNSHRDNEKHTFAVTYLGDGYYSIINENSGLSLDVANGGWENASNVQLYEQNQTDAQKWMIKDCGDGTYCIISKRNGLVLDVEDACPANGTNIQMWMANQTNAQKWRLIPYNRKVEVEKISLEQDRIIMSVGSQQQIKTIFSPGYATETTLTWKSSAPLVADVDDNGIVTAKSVGTAMVTVTSENGKTAFCNVIVEKKATEPINPEVTVVPETTNKPKETASPIASSKPNATTSPETTNKPKETVSPIVSSKPDVTTAPETTSRPKESSSPIASSKPDVTTAPETTSRPKETISPIPSSKPDNEDISSNETPSAGTVLEDGENNVSYKVLVQGKAVAFYQVNNKKTSKIVIPTTVTIDETTYNVTAVSDNAFSGCKMLKSVIVGKYVTTIGNKVFFKCISLRKITIPTSVTKIGKRAFYGCKKLKSITIKTKKLKSKSVGSQAFKGIHKKAVIKVPKKQKKAYKKWLKKRGITKKMKIK